MAESFPDIRVLHPECSFLDESLSERIAMRAIQSDSELRGIYLTSAGREGVYRAVHAAHRSEKLHIVVHDITEGNIKMVKNGTVDFIIGQDVKTQGTLPIRLLYDYLERHQFPRVRMNMTANTINSAEMCKNSCFFQIDCKTIKRAYSNFKLYAPVLFYQ